jgi:hypothetical protein
LLISCGCQWFLNNIHSLICICICSRRGSCLGLRFDWLRLWLRLWFRLLSSWDLSFVIRSINDIQDVIIVNWGRLCQAKSILLLQLIF